jgi:OOP family OmpA-OmpF porin
MDTKGKRRRGRVDFKDEEGHNVSSATTDRSGKFVTVLPPGVTVSPVANGPGLLPIKGSPITVPDSATVNIPVEAFPIRPPKSSSDGTAPSSSGAALELYFEHNDSTLSTKGKQELDQLYQALRKRKQTLLLTFSGHSDNTGDKETNLSLSLARANAVRAYLISKGYPEEYLRAKGMGDSQPRADNATEKGRALNRRVEVNAVYAKGKR